MFPEIITFNKTMEFRLEEYEQLLDEIETPCSEIIEIWGSLLSELAVVGTNWQALWILSEENCKKYSVLFPTAVVVNVDGLQFSELMATVSVIAVQEDIVLPSLLDVPMIELHPIKDQNYDETDLRDIEDWLDKCRYFFKHLWYPWDAKLEVTLMDWSDSHLENRLKMQYDLKNGVFDKTIANYLKLLLEEAQNVGATTGVYYSGGDDRISAVSKYIRRETIKTELDLFEEPYLRYGIIQLKKKEKRLKNSSVEANEGKFVWLGGTGECLVEYLKKTQLLLENNMNVKVFGSLQEALDAADRADVIVLTPNNHGMTSLRGIEDGGCIKSWDVSGTQIIPDASAASKAILFECYGDIELENLTISKSTGITIQVFKGTVKLTNCRLISEKNSTSRGIVVISGSKLILEGCELIGFGTAVAVQANAEATLIDTQIRDCYEGIKVIEDGKVFLDKVDIVSCSTYGIRVESSKVESNTPIVGDLNLLEGDSLGCQIKAQFINLSNNSKGNVIVKQIEKVFSVEELSESLISSEVVFVTDGDTSDNSIEIL